MYGFSSATDVNETDNQNKHKYNRHEYKRQMINISFYTDTRRPHKTILKMITKRMTKHLTLAMTTHPLRKNETRSS